MKDLIQNLYTEFQKIQQSINDLSPQISDLISQFNSLPDEIQERSLNPAISGRTVTIKRKINYLVIHATASHQHFSASDIQNWFIAPKNQGGQGWSRGGYHVMIEPNGKIVRLYNNDDYTNGVKPYSANGLHISNTNSVHISWIGGITKSVQPIDNRTNEQKDAMIKVVKWYIENIPNLVILGHNQCDNKPCPMFSVPNWLRANFPELPESQIYSKDNFGYLAKLQ